MVILWLYYWRQETLPKTLVLTVSETHLYQHRMLHWHVFLGESLGMSRSDLKDWFLGQSRLFFFTSQCPPIGAQTKA